VQLEPRNPVVRPIGAPLAAATCALLEAGAAVGSLIGLDLYPDLNALIAQVSYGFGHR
jgi:hypothetical protein